ncbi:MAG: GNAT family N-acetyltransferase [Terriglobales bacterium]
MNDLPEHLFANPAWHALQTKHRHLAVCAGDACRYSAEVAPFVAVAAQRSSALGELHSLLAPGESAWLIGDHWPRVPELVVEETMGVLQMALPEEITPAASTTKLVSLSAADAAEMVALTNLAFPGFFRKRTHEMGAYYGVRSEGELIAMGGERLVLEGYSEISGICTHPAHRGKGLAASLIWQLVSDHRRDGIVSWLHVSASNERAIALYLRLGFKVVRKIDFNRISRK